MSRTSVTTATLAAALLLTACGHDDPPAPQDAPPATEQAPARHVDPREDILETALSAALTVFPFTDYGLGAGWDRARPMLDPAASFPGQGPSAITGQPPAALGPLYAWQAEGVEKVEASAEVVADQHPPDTDTSAQRVVVVHFTKHHRDGHTVPDPNQTYYATAKRIDGQWLLSEATRR